MKIPAVIGKGLLFGFGALGLASLAGLTSGAKAPALAVSHCTLSIRHVETCSRPESLISPLVAEVRRVIARHYLVVGPDEPAALIVGTALRNEYGTSVTELSEPMAYFWKWNPITERWEWVCGGSASFLVEFAGQGSVLVETNDDMVLR